MKQFRITGVRYVEDFFPQQDSTGSMMTPLKGMDGELVFTSGTIMFEGVEFEAESEGDTMEVEFERDGDVMLDFATGVTTPDISYITIPAGTYEEIDIEMELKDDGDTPAIVLEGVYTDLAGTDHLVRFEYNSGETFEVELEGSIVFAEDVSFTAQVTIDPASWFTGVSDQDFTSAVKNDSDVIVISSTSNTNIYGVVANGLELASEVEFNNDDDDDDDDDDK
ncbi:MAG: hypothetical protein LC649_11730 [Bacteroidales bacterium]|nr:hypothetical protein [Bacteroidales bacterium]